MVYHCPKCHKELIQEDYTGKEKWLIGPLFIQLIKHLKCKVHGYIDYEDLVPEERKIAFRNKWMGITGGILFYVIIVILILLAYRKNY